MWCLRLRIGEVGRGTSCAKVDTGRRGIRWVAEGGALSYAYVTRCGICVGLVLKSLGIPARLLKVVRLVSLLVSRFYVSWHSQALELE